MTEKSPEEKHKETEALARLICRKEGGNPDAKFRVMSLGGVLMPVPDIKGMEVLPQMANWELFHYIPAAEMLDMISEIFEIKLKEPSPVV